MISASRSNRDSELQPIKGGTVVDMDDEHSHQVCTFIILNLRYISRDESERGLSIFK